MGQQPFDPGVLKGGGAVDTSGANKFEDALIWRGTANGVFWVKSAYHMLKEWEERNKAVGSSGGRTSTLWGQLWKLQIPNIEKHFLWRACNEILPTRVNLCSRRVTINPNCPICEKEEETTFHILWQCSST